MIGTRSIYVALIVDLDVDQKLLGTVQIVIVSELFERSDHALHIQINH